MGTNYRWILLLAISAMIFIINVDYTAVNLALGAIATDFHSNLASIQWVLSAYILAWSIFVIPAGKYADLYLERRVCLFGIILFVFASFIGGAAVSASMLVLARVVQGIAAAIYVPTFYALIYSNFDINERGHIIGLFSLAVGLGMAIGPLIGGLFVTWLSWRYIFFVNIPLGLVCFYIIYKSKDEVKLATSSAVSKASVSLLSMSIVTSLYILSQWQLWSVYQVFYFSLVVVAAMSLGCFMYLQLKIINPLIPLQLFLIKPFMGSCLGILIEQYCFSSIIICTGLYLQNVLELSLLNSSLIYLFLTVMFAIIAIQGGNLVDRVSLRFPVVLGLVIIAMGAGSFAFLTQNSNIILVCTVVAILGAGMGMAFAGLNSGVVKTVPQKHIGISSSIFLMFALLGNSIGVAFTTMIYQKTTFATLINKLLLVNVALDKNKIHQLLSYISHIGSQHSDLNLFNNGAQKIITTEAVRSFGVGVSNVMLVNFALSLFALLLCTILIKKPSSEKVK